MDLDHSVYPDFDQPPANLETAEEMADYVQRICAAWDFYIHPEPETFALFSSWRDVFDRFPLVTSAAYHTFRAWFGWPPMAPPPNMLAATPQWAIRDQLEGRDPDPCEKMV